jgi:hypothetical protein
MHYRNFWHIFCLFLNIEVNFLKSLNFYTANQLVQKLKVAESNFGSLFNILNCDQNDLAIYLLMRRAFVRTRVKSKTSKIYALELSNIIKFSALHEINLFTYLTIC